MCHRKKMVNPSFLLNGISQKSTQAGSGKDFLGRFSWGIFLGGFARDVVIADNEFSWLGESGIVSVGDTDGAPIPGWGADGRAGNQVMLQLMAAFR